MNFTIYLNDQSNYLNFRKPLVDFLISNNHNVTIVINEKYDNRKDVNELSRRYISLNSERASYSIIAFIKNIISLFITIRTLEKQKAIIAFTMYNSLALALTPVSRKKKIAVLTGLGTTGLDNSILGRFRLFIIQNLILLLCQKVIVQNDEDYKDLSKYKKNIYVLYGSGVSTNLPLKRNYTFTRRLVCIARLISEKGLIELAKAIKKFNDENPEQMFTLDLYGSYSICDQRSISPDYLQLISGGQVTYLGVDEAVSQKLKNYDALILASHREGLSKSVLEALSVGLPIVISDCIGNRQFIQRGIKGHYFMPKSIQGIKSSLIEFSKTSVDERASNALINLKIVETEFSQNVIFTKLEDIIFE